MRNILFSSAALILLSSAAQADDQVRKDLGTASGTLGGAAVGAVVGGPVGAVVGGVAGAIIGSNASVPEHVRTYAVAHPVDDVAIDGDLSADYAFSDDVRIYEIPDNPDYGYVYVQHRPVIVRTNSRKVVYAPARDVENTSSISGDVSDDTITYVRKHPVRRVVIDGGVEMGATLPDSVELTDVPDSPDYAYVYTDDGPVLVRRDSRRVIWVH